MAEEKQPVSAEDLERSRVDADELSWALRAALRASVEIEPVLARRLSLRPLDYTALMHLVDSPSPIGPAELAERVGVSSGSATELVDRLERSGHLVRTPHASDRRRIGLRPTEPAVARLLEVLEPLLRGMDQLASEFDAVEREAIRRYLRGVEQHLHEYVRTDGPARS